MVVGVSKITQNGFLSGLNNLVVCSMKSTNYQPFFGFTEPEVKILLSDTPNDEMKRVKEYYNGYIVPFLTEDDKRVPIPMNVFNPWSIGNFKNCQTFESSWANTSSILILKDFIQRTMDASTFNDLVLKAPIPKNTNLQHDMPYSNINSAGLQEIITFMFNAGFLTQDETFTHLRVPNEEIRGAMLSMLKDIISSRNVALDKPYKYFQDGKIDDF
jgi:Predicted AAA-ATPase